MSGTSTISLTKEWASALETVKSLAEGPDSVDADSRTAALKLLWSAAVRNRDRENLPKLEDLHPDTRQLLHLADNEQLAEHLARAATKAVVALGKQIKQAASTTATSNSTDGDSSNAAMQQDAAAALPVTKAAVLPAVQLLTTYATVQRAWLNHPKYTGEMFGTMALQVMINQQLQETGLVRVLSAACPELVAAIKQQQQQQQSPADAEALLCTRLLAAAVLHVLRRCILADRPAQIFWDPTLAPMLLPTVKLSAACLQAYTGPLLPAAAAAATDCSTAAAASDGIAAAAAFDGWVQLWQEDSMVGLEPICIADHLSYAIIQGYRWKPEEWLNEPSLVALLSAPELHLLMALHAAAGTQHSMNLKRAAAAAAAESTQAQSSLEESATQQQDPQQDSATTQQQLKGKRQQDISAVPAWHERVFAACGLPAGVDLAGVFVLWGDDSPSTACVAVLGLALQMIGGGFWNQRFHQMSSTVGMLRVKEEARQRQQQQQQQQSRRRSGPFGAIGELPDAAIVPDPDLRSALILLLIQQLLVSPHMKQAVVNAKLISQLASKGYCCDPDPLLSAAAAAVRESGDMSAPETIAASAAVDHSGPRSCASAALTAPVLLQLGPVLQGILERFEPSAEPDVQPEDIDALTACYASAVAVATLADGIAHAGHMAAALQQQPALRSLELAVRASAGNFGGSLIPDVPMFILKPLRQLYDDASPAVSKLLPNTYRPPPGYPTPAAAAAAAAGDHAGLSCSSSSSGGEVSRPDSFALFSLLLSGLKLYTGVVGKVPQQQQQAGPLELLSYCVDALALLLSMSELNEAPGGATCVQHRWLVLAGRLLMGTGQALKDLRANSRSIIASIGAIPTEPPFLEDCLQSITNSIAWLGASLGKLQPPAVADTELQQTLLSQQRVLHMLLLQQVLPQLRPELLDVELTTAHFLAELQRLLPAGCAQQLQAVGEGVCGLLPLPFCCNSPSCLRCVGSGEEASVKNGRCSSCKAAHYCCAACQKQHWSAQHKALCKRLKEQPESVAACLEAA